MLVKELSLCNFRNISELKAELHPGINLFYGDNAQGKTNILESVFVAGTTKSKRGSKDRDLIKIGEEEGHVKMFFERSGVEHRIDVHLKRNKPKGIAIDGFPIRRAGDLLEMTGFVFFSPLDLDLVKDGPGERRRFIDSLLCRTDGIYLSALGRYRHCLDQRNRLLHAASFDGKAKDQLFVWDEMLAESGRILIKSRRECLEKCGREAAGRYADLTGKEEILSLIYEPNTNEDDLGERLERSRDRDIRFQTTHVGPHRDDIGVFIGDRDIRLYGSQGQQRSAALCIKMAETEIIEEAKGEKPVLLLDDVLSELDRKRQKALLSSIKDIQVLITCTGLDEFVENGFAIDKTFRVTEGSIS